MHLTLSTRCTRHVYLTSLNFTPTIFLEQVIHGGVKSFYSFFLGDEWAPSHGRCYKGEVCIFFFFFTLPTVPGRYYVEGPTKHLHYSWCPTCRTIPSGTLYLIQIYTWFSFNGTVLCLWVLYLWAKKPLSDEAVVSPYGKKASSYRGAYRVSLFT